MPCMFFKLAGTERRKIQMFAVNMDQEMQMHILYCYCAVIFAGYLKNKLAEYKINFELHGLEPQKIISVKKRANYLFFV